MSHFLQQIRAPKKVLTIFLLGSKPPTKIRGWGCLFVDFSQPGLPCEPQSADHPLRLGLHQWTPRHLWCLQRPEQGGGVCLLPWGKGCSWHILLYLTKLLALIIITSQSYGHWTDHLASRQYLFSGPKIVEESEMTKERCLECTVPALNSTFES